MPRRSTSNDEFDTIRDGRGLLMSSPSLLPTTPAPRTRGRSVEKKSRRRKNKTAVPIYHSQSLGAVTMYPSSLRVKSQFDSLKQSGLSGIKGPGEDRRVEFAFLEVREFPIILGDNPSCMDGPPVTIDWAYDPGTRFILDVNTFERMRGARRDSGQLVLPKAVREKRLLKCGVSQNDIAKVLRQVRKDKHHRMISSQQTNLDPMHEVMEKASVGIKKMFLFKKTSYEKTLEAACTHAPARRTPNKMSHALSA